jgi:hypothetical protein
LVEYIACDDGRTGTGVVRRHHHSPADLRSLDGGRGCRWTRDGRHPCIGPAGWSGPRRCRPAGLRVAGLRNAAGSIGTGRSRWRWGTRGTLLSSSPSLRRRVGV